MEKKLTIEKINSMKQFAILHELEGTQFLVDTHFNHEDNVHELSYKFWSVRINGFLKATMGWEEDKETDFLKTFEKFKDKAYCVKFKLATESKLFRLTTLDKSTYKS